MSVSNKQKFIIRATSGLTAALFVLVVFVKVLEIGSSTGAIFFFALPVYGIISYSISFYLLNTYTRIRNKRHLQGAERRIENKELYVPTFVSLLIILSLQALVFSYYYSDKISSAQLSESELKEHYYGLWTRYDRNALLGLVKNTSMSPELLGEIVKTTHFDLNKDVWGIRALFTEDSRSLAERIASHENVPTMLLEKWSVNSPYGLKKAIAGNDKTPVSILDSLSNNEYSAIRIIVAGNSNAGIETLSRLASDPDQYVRMAVAMNGNVPLNILDQLLDDEERSVAATAKSMLDRRGNGR